MHTSAIVMRVKKFDNPSINMKTFLFILAIVYLALSGAVSAKPTANRKEALLNKLLALKQDDSEDRKIILIQDDDDDGTALEQDEGDDRIHLQEDEEGEGGAREQDGDDDGEAAMIQNFGKLLKKADQKVVLAKLQALKVSSQSRAEAQWWHHIFHWFHHLFHHHHHHHRHHHHWQ